jgi:hypothetical protein
LCFNDKNEPTWNKKQDIPSSHETFIEAHRLLALALSLLGEFGMAIEHHEMFWQSAAQAIT